MTTLMFPGQGSQTKGMGAELFNQFPSEVRLAQEVLGYSIQELCLNDPNNQLANTEFTQPALFFINALTYKSKYAHNVDPSYCIGHSLGEYAALYAAGAFDLVTGLKLVQKRGALMAKANGGKMLAVINLSINRISEILQANGLISIDFANYNSQNQVVISGPINDMSKAQELLSKEALMCVPLNVSAAFHSRYMESAAKEFEQFLEPFKMSHLQTQVIANFSAQPYTNATIKANLVKQITSPVLWVDTIHYIKNTGVSEFIEVGPGTVLTRLLNQMGIAD